MNIIEEINSAFISDDNTGELQLSIDSLKELADSHQRLLKAAKKVYQSMQKSSDLMNFKFTLETAIDQADKLAGNGGD